MSKSTRLTLKDVRQAFRLVGDCRDVGGDPVAWNSVVAQFCNDEMGAVLTTSFRQTFRPKVGPTVEQVYCDMWVDDGPRQIWLEMIANYGYRDLLTVRRFFEKYEGELQTKRRADLVPDREWRQSAELNENRLVCGQDDVIISVHPTNATGGGHVFSINRGADDKAFTPRERDLFRLVHEELGRLFHTRLNLNGHPGGLLGQLKPREREVFAGLMRGDNEKQIALALGLSRHTVHEYVARLYRRFEVHSRAGLLAAGYQHGWKETTQTGEE